MGLVLGIAVAGPISGGAINPAFGLVMPILQNWLYGVPLDQIWVHVIGPLLGGALAGYLQLVFIRGPLPHTKGLVKKFLALRVKEAEEVAHAKEIAGKVVSESAPEKLSKVLPALAAAAGPGNEDSADNDRANVKSRHKRTHSGNQVVHWEHGIQVDEEADQGESE